MFEYSQFVKGFMQFLRKWKEKALNFGHLCTCCIWENLHCIFTDSPPLPSSEYSLSSFTVIMYPSFIKFTFYSEEIPDYLINWIINLNDTVIPLRHSHKVNSFNQRVLYFNKSCIYLFLIWRALKWWR